MNTIIIPHVNFLYSFLRSILSVNDEFYHRHIIQHDLFAPVFEAFRANPVGDNLVSSAIIEMCDFIHTENIKSLVEHIVTKHLVNSATPFPSLEDVSSPYVDTLTILRKAYENNLRNTNKALMSDSIEDPADANNDSHNTLHVVLNEKAREDQRKFREVDEEESYFDADDDDGSTTENVVAAEIEEHGSLNDMDERVQMLSSATQASLLHDNTNTMSVDTLSESMSNELEVSTQ